MLCKHLELMRHKLLPEIRAGVHFHFTVPWDIQMVQCNLGRDKEVNG